MMTLATVLLLTVLAAEGAAAPADPASRLISETSTLLLEGQGLPRDMRLRLLALEPADRLRVIAYLRRVGLMKGAAWTASDLLLPATEPQEGGR